MDYQAVLNSLMIHFTASDWPIGRHAPCFCTDRLQEAEVLGAFSIGNRH